MADTATPLEPESRGGLARIGAFELDVAAAELRRSGRLVALTGQPMRVLMRLVARAGELVTREELQREIWGAGTHVDFEAGLSTCINQIRAALGDRAVAPRFVETLPRRGYRFVAPVEWAAAPIEPRPSERVRTVLQTIGVRRTVAAPAVAAAALSVMALAMWPVAPQPARPPVPFTMLAVDVDSARSDLQPASRTLRDALIGALATEAGDRGRVLGPRAAEVFETMPLDQGQKAGIDYVIFVTLRSLGGPTLVHVKLVGPGGWVRWTTDRVMTLEELERTPLSLAREFSKPIVQRILLERQGG